MCLSTPRRMPRRKEGYKTIFIQHVQHDNDKEKEIYTRHILGVDITDTQKSNVKREGEPSAPLTEPLSPRLTDDKVLSWQGAQGSVLGERCNWTGIHTFFRSFPLI